MLRTNLPEQMQELLSTEKYATLSTVCDDGAPWNTPLAFAIDDYLHMYWASARSSRHSHNLRRRPTVFMVVAGTAGSALEGCGLYIRMDARELSAKPEVDAALQCYDPDFFRSYNADTSFLGACPTRIYQAVPLDVWRNTKGFWHGYYVDKRQRIKG